MAKSGVYEPIDIVPGVEPVTDMTMAATKHYVYSDKIRFQDGKAQKIGGWQTQTFDYDMQIEGTVRSIFTDFINGKF